MRGVLAHRSDAVFLVLGIVGVNATIALATLVPEGTGAEFASWPVIGVGAVGVLRAAHSGWLSTRSPFRSGSSAIVR